MLGLLLEELVRGEFVGWPEQDSFGGNRNPAGIRRNPEESGGNIGIPVPQEFLQKNPVKVAENRNFQDPSKTTFPRTNSSEKKQKKGILRNPVFSVFQSKK
jgi:hypothetical protein